MLSYNFKYELKTLIRSKWIQALSGILLVVMLFAGFNGKQKVDKRHYDIQKVKEQVAEDDREMISLLDSVAQGHKTSVSPWRIPTSPMVVANYYPRVVSMSPQALTFTAVGQSDLFTHYVQPKVYGDDFSLNYTEMSSPVQLLFGSFDLSFVIIYLLPLLIIAFTYNILSNEKESGSLKILASQPMSIYIWLLQKLLLRFFWLAIITLFIITLTFLLNDFSFTDNLGSFLSFAGLVTVYMLFWFSVSFIVNLLVGSSAKNAISLLGLWVLIVLMLPAIVSQLGNTIYPVPSRTKMINEIRTIKAEAKKQQDKILDNYLRDHPEYATNNSGNYSFWHKYIASQKLVKDKIAPLVADYDLQLEKQQQWIQQWQYISPSIILQQSFNQLAGTSTASYEDFRKQVIGFSEKWKEHFIPMLYKDKTFKSSLVKELPTFSYTPYRYDKGGQHLFILLIFPILIGAIGWYFFNNKLKKGSVIT